MPAFDYDITSVPYSQTVPQSVFNAGNQVIFRFTSAIKTMLGARTNTGGTFAPRLSVLANDGTTVLYAAQSGNGGHNWPMLTPETYYVKVVRNGGGPSDFDFTLDFDIFALDDFSIEDGDRLINDDNDLPGTLLAADGTLKSYVSAVPGGEIGGILPNGVSAWYDAFGHHHATNRIALLDSDANYLTSVSVGNTGQPNILAGRTKFWVITNADHLWTVTDSGVAADTGYVFPAGAKVWVGAVNPDETILYWARKSNEGIIHALDLNTLTPLANLYTIPGFAVNVDEIANTPNNKPGDMLALDDGTIVTWWYKKSIDQYHVIHLDPSGALLDDYLPPSGEEYVDHLAIVYGQSDYVLIWRFDADLGPRGLFGQLNLAAGTITNDVPTAMFEQGYNSADEPALFGPSTSCTFVAFGTGSGGGSHGDVDIEEAMIGPYVWVHWPLRRQAV